MYKNSTLGHSDGLHVLNGSIGFVSAFASGGQKGATYMCFSEFSEKYLWISDVHAPNVALFCDDLFGLALPKPSVLYERDLDVAALLVHAAAVL